MSLFYFAANLFSIWLNEGRLDSLLCLCIRSVAMSCVVYILGNSNVCLRKNEMEPVTSCHSVFRKIVLTPQAPGQILRSPRAAQTAYLGVNSQKLDSLCTQRVAIFSNDISALAESG